MKKVLIAFLLLISCKNVFAQGRNAIWCFGDSAGIDFNNTSNSIPISTGLSPKGSCVSIADSSGHLLFYAGVDDNAGYVNGKLKTGMVYNKDNNLMNNGDSLISDAWYHEMIILSDPTNNQLFYLFHIGITYNFGLFYSVIDMTQDSGRGAVIAKNNVLDTFPAIDCLQAVKHANGRDWWLIYRRSHPYTNDFYKYLISPSGVQLYSVDSAGQVDKSGAGDFVFNSDGSQFAYCNWKGMLSLFNFDRCTGEISLEKSIEREDTTGNLPYYEGCAFSPNDSMLYVSSNSYFTTSNINDLYVLQYNLYATNITASRQIIGQFQYPAIPSGVRLAPDKKIYISTDPDLYPYGNSDFYTSNMNLSVINDPNNLDTACHFQPFSFYLGGKRSYWGLPNNPNYDLGPVVGSICDSLINWVNEQISNNSIAIFPNPFNDKVNIRVESKSIKQNLLIFDQVGQCIYQSKFSSNEQTLDLSALKPGVYTFVINSMDNAIRTQVVKIK